MVFLRSIAAASLGALQMMQVPLILVFSKFLGPLVHHQIFVQIIYLLGGSYTDVVQHKGGVYCSESLGEWEVSVMMINRRC